MSDIFSFGQILGYIASLTLIIGYTFKADDLTKKILVVSSLLFMTHFYFIGAMTASAVCFVNALRNISSLLFYKSVKFFIFFIIAYLVLGIFTINHFIDVLPLLAAMGTCLGMFLLGGIRFRVIVVIATLLWLVHNIYVGSIGGTINTVVLFFISISVVYKLYKENLRHETHR